MLALNNPLMKRRLPNLIGLLALAGAAAAAPVDYLGEVKPLFSEHCYRCHGASQQKHGLRLDTAASALKGGENGPAVKPGRSAESLIVQVVKGAHDALARMPYKKPPLSDAQIRLLARWIDEGAKAPANEKPEKTLHWSFVAPSRPPLPQIRNRKSEFINPIDAFILARLAKDNLKPSPEADRVTLIRRLSLDLTGLPPGTAEVDAFVKDRSPEAYEKGVDRLLSSPHYGERWGRHWLDVARYADSNGYSIDAPRSIWKYREWVIKALNRDLPFDQFAIWQIAGDLIETNFLGSQTSALEPLIATGFNRNTQINQEGGIDPEQFRVESVMDRVNTTATAFLGVTLACAQCHDHKFDPFTQKEYYQFYAFFNSTLEDGHGKGAPEGMLEIPGENEAAESLQKELEEAEGDLDRFLNTKGSELVKWEETLTEDEKSRLKPEARKALGVAFAERTMKQKRAVYAAFKPDDAEFKQRNTKLAKLEKNQPKPVTTLVMRELDKPRETHVFTKGDFTRPAAIVEPGVPGILHPFSGGTNANRLDLARWLVDTNNPLTARVIVNRIWQQYFGRGLVETENDFGTQGTPPSHPELLDWLACELMNPAIRHPSLEREPKTEGSSSSLRNSGLSSGSDSGLRTADLRPWSLKHLHRLIVTSAAYRQSSKARPDLALIDPNNRLLARQNRLRLDAEIVRDVCLTASGLMNDRIGGPSVFPPQPDGVMNLGQSKREWKPSTGADRYRRGMYTFFWRATPHPSLMVFDSSDGFSTCTRRLRSNTPLQALTLLNDEAFHEFAQALAARVLKEGPQTDSARVELAFRLCLSRPPAADERKRLLDLLNHDLAALDVSPPEGGGNSNLQTDRKQLAAWTTVSRVLLNLDETITRE
jgi:mono/diheme cytochrome c family protein